MRVKDVTNFGAAILISLIDRHELCEGLFEIYHSGLLSSNQGLTRTYYKMRQDFYIRNLYKYLYLYIMSCRICSARRDIPFNLKQRSWSSAEIQNFNIMESLSMDLKVMPTSFKGYNYLMVMHCNNSCYIITDVSITRKANEIAESTFQKLICPHGTNINEIYCDLDTAFKNELILILSSSFKIKVKFHSVESYQSNPDEQLIQSISNIIIHYISKYNNTWCLFCDICLR